MPTERPIIFACGANRLHGVLALPDAAAAIGVVIVVGGPQYRVGSHRQFVLLARSLAGAGFATLRFDVSGMGDSDGVPRGFEHQSDDIAAAIGALQQQVPAVRQVVLWGLCDGASAALLYCHERGDPGVAGLCLVNPWVRSAASLAQTHLKHYYLDRLRERDFWVKLLTGRVAKGALATLLGNARLAWGKGPGAAPRENFQRRMAFGWRDFGGAILLLTSGRDLTAKEFTDHAAADPAWREALRQVPPQHHDLPEADHTLSDRAAAVAVEGLTVEWLHRLGRPRQAQPTAAATPCEKELS